MSSQKYFSLSYYIYLEKDKKGGKFDEEFAPEEELHNFLQDLKREKEQREKYKAITGREAPRELVAYVQP